MIDRRHGVALNAVLLTAVCFSMLVFGMMKFSSSELRAVSRLVDKKQAEYLAYAGINWASAELAKKRWYQPPGSPPSKVERPAWGMKTLEPFGTGQGKVTVFCQEAGRLGVDVKDDDLYGRFDKIDLLDHIKVYALGECRDEKAMYYGKFIMSPDPYLNSDSTDAPGTGAAGGATTSAPGLVEIPVERAFAQDGSVEQKFTVVSINVTVGQQIDINTVCATLKPATLAITQTYDVKGVTYGKLKEIRTTVGAQINAGDVFGIMEEDCGSVRPTMTLKKMVQINHIDLRPFRGKDLADAAVLHQIGQEAKATALEFVVNYTKNAEVSAKLPGVMASPELPPQTSEAEIIRRIETSGQQPKYDVNKAGNRFILDLMSRWVPDGFKLDPAAAQKFAAGARYNLGHRRGHPRAEIKEILEGSGHADILKKLYDTKPWNDEGFHVVNGTEKYQGKMSDQYNDNMSTTDMIKGLSFLGNARKSITITLMGGTPLEDKPFKDAVAKGEINAADYWWWARRQGWYKQPTITGPTPSSVAYTYENDTTNPPIRLRNDYILNYLRKHYDEGGITAFSNKLRMPGDQNDTPQAPGPPDSTGARYSGGT